MAKKKDDIFNFIASELDGDVLADMAPVKYFIDTGSLAFNWVLSGKFMGGGIPGGKVTEFFGPEASGKCIAEDMEVLLSNGETKTIRNIFENKDTTPVISLNEDTQKFEAVIVDQFWANGEKECFEVKTTSGNRIITTINHLYYTKKGWKDLQYLRKGDFIASIDKSLTTILWAEVESIKYVGKKMTYDLGIAKNHNFVANNCVVHNSYWGANIVRGAQAVGAIPVYLDCENALNNDFVVKTSHIDLNQTVRFDPSKGIDCLEGVFNKIYNVIRKVREAKNTKSIIFVYDSIAASPSARELRETQVDMNKISKENLKKLVGGKEQPGERAKICSKELRKMGSILEKNNATLLVLNQTRMRIGTLYGNPECCAGGGESLKFYASCRVRTSVSKKIENKKLKTSIGINLKVSNRKNRCCAPFRVAEDVHLYWSEGVNPLSGLLTCLIQDGRIEQSGKGMYTVLEPWAAGQEIKFQASKAKNEVGEEVLLRCPALIDAATEQEVRDYLDIFAPAIKQDSSDELEEVDASDEESSDADYGD